MASGRDDQDMRDVDEPQEQMRLAHQEERIEAGTGTVDYRSTMYIV